MSEEQAKQFIEQATQSLQSGQFQQALELIDQAIALKETDEAHILRGISLSQLGQPDGATEAFRRAIMLGPQNPKAYFNLAVHQYAQGRKVEALEMAREAVRLDNKHAGARDLMARVEAETTTTTTYDAPRVQDDSAKTAAPSAPEMPGGIPGPGGPQAPGGPGPAGPSPQSPYQTPPQGGYYRPGYETSGAHSLQFVGNMGKTWDMIGWVLAGFLLVAFVLYWVTNASELMKAFSNPEQMQRMGGFGSFGAMGAFELVMAILGLVARLGALVWMILELTDRRGNWLWLLPYILCCCCGLDWLVMGIYLLAGRQK